MGWAILLSRNRIVILDKFGVMRYHFLRRHGDVCPFLFEEEQMKVMRQWAVECGTSRTKVDRCRFGVEIKGQPTVNRVKCGDDYFEDVVYFGIQ